MPAMSFFPGRRRFLPVRLSAAVLGKRRVGGKRLAFVRCRDPARVFLVCAGCPDGSGKACGRLLLRGRDCFAGGVLLAAARRQSVRAVWVVISFLGAETGNLDSSSSRGREICGKVSRMRLPCGFCRCGKERPPGGKFVELGKIGSFPLPLGKTRC